MTSFSNIQQTIRGHMMSGHPEKADQLIASVWKPAGCEPEDRHRKHGLQDRANGGVIDGGKGEMDRETQRTCPRNEE